MMSEIPEESLQEIVGVRADLPRQVGIGACKDIIAPRPPTLKRRINGHKGYMIAEILTFGTFFGPKPQNNV